MKRSIFNSYVKGTVKSLLECLTDKSSTYYSKNPTEFKYYREPDSVMKQKAKQLIDCSFNLTSIDYIRFKNKRLQ